MNSMRSIGDKQEGSAFQMTTLPTIGTLLYFAFVIGMTSQVSDVTVKSKALRRIVLAHGLLSFVFNVSLLAVAINLAASALGSLGSS
jgi:uncharacterized membrane protein